MFINGKIAIKADYLDGGFLMSFGKRTIIDEDIDANQYKKVIRYMNDKAIIDNNLILKLLNERKYVSLLVDYISKNLTWGTNVIELIPKDILSKENIDRGDISKGIKRLIELEIIVQANTRKDYEGLSKYLYIVNHNYIFKGNIKNLIKDIKDND